MQNTQIVKKAIKEIGSENFTNETLQEKTGLTHVKVATILRALREQHIIFVIGKTKMGKSSHKRPATRYNVQPMRGWI